MFDSLPSIWRKDPDNAQDLQRKRRVLAFALGLVCLSELISVGLKIVHRFSR